MLLQIQPSVKVDLSLDVWIKIGGGGRTVHIITGEEKIGDLFCIIYEILMFSLRTMLC